MCTNRKSDGAWSAVREIMRINLILRKISMSVTKGEWMWTALTSLVMDEHMFTIYLIISMRLRS